MFKSKSPLDRIYELVTRLRAPDGCPWDREQTNYTIRYDLVEEAYEVIEAIESNNNEALKEELGDLLFLVLMHIRIAEEEGKLTLKEVSDGIISKMVARHPHVFGEKVFKNRNELLANWEKSKKNAFAGLALSMPALLLAQKVASRKKRLGLADKENYRGIEDLLGENISSEKLAELLFKIAQVAQERDINLEESLRNYLKREIEKLKSAQ